MKMEQKDINGFADEASFSRERIEESMKKRVVREPAYAPSTAVLQAEVALDNDEGGIEFSALLLGDGDFVGGGGAMLFLGSRLIEKKEQWGKNFNNHLKRIGISTSSAYLWMRCAKRFFDQDGKGGPIHDVYLKLPIGLLYKILRKRLSDETVLKALGVEESK